MSVLERPPPVGASRKFHVCGAKAVICGAGVCGAGARSCDDNNRVDVVHLARLFC